MTNLLRLPPLVRAFLTIAAFVALVDTFNVFTTIHDLAEHGQRLPTWEPAVWESTSGISTLLACAIIYAAIRIAPPGRTRWPEFILVHLFGSLLFSGVHVVLMNAMRVGIYAATGHHYVFDESGFLYEYRKDLIAYIVWAAVFWLFTRQQIHLAAAPAGESQVIAIQDGKRLIRVPVGEIAAVRAAGNYVEFLLLDGRRPLARKSLRQAQDELGDRGFVRTHRSWLVNLSHVREVTPVGAGDYRLGLGGSTEAPLSRRFRDALASLKQMTPQ